MSRLSFNRTNSTEGGFTNVLAKPGSPNPDRTGALYNHAINPIITAQTRGGCGDRSAISSNIWTSPDKRIVIHNGDCMAAMAEMRDRQFELAICDPPYGIGEDGGKTRRIKSRHAKKNWDKNIPSKEYFDELFRVSENQIIWGGNYFSQYLPGSMGWVFWDKKKENSDFSDGELAFTSFNVALKKIAYSKTGGNVSEFCSRYFHPCEKPIFIYRWLLTNYAKPGDHILDTHAGSCSLAIACHDLGFKLTAYEIDADYFKSAIERIEKHLSQPKLPCCDPNTMNQGRLI